jgi:hypothetical protein
MYYRYLCEITKNTAPGNVGAAGTMQKIPLVFMQRDLRIHLLLLKLYSKVLQYVTAIEKYGAKD